MSDAHPIALRFETHRPHLLAVATRLLGSATEAGDAVQEAWFRLDRAGISGIENLGGWLTTVVSRICLDYLRTRSSRAEEPVDEVIADVPDEELNPEDVALLWESTTDALAILLDSLTPIERVTFVLHDVFDVPFEEVATIVDRSPAATRQLARRARRKVRSATTSGRRSTPPREIVSAFFAAAREGQLEALIRLLAPDVVLHADAQSVALGGVPTNLFGARSIAETFSGKAQAARLATINDEPGATWAPGGKPRVVFTFTITDGAIVAINMIADNDVIAAMEITLYPKV